MSDTFPKYQGVDAVPDWQLHTTQVVNHDWTLNGWDPFFKVVINIHGNDSYSDTIVTGRGRITGTGTNGNRREWRLHRDTNFANSEVRSLWWGGSVWDSGGSGATPQMGHVHRAKEVAPGVWQGWVVSNNIFLTEQNTINQNIWEGAGTSTLILGSRGGSKTFPLARTLQVTGVTRVNFLGWINQYVVNPKHMYGIKNGDLVTTTSLDSTFVETGQPVTVDYATGAANIPEAVTQSGVAAKFDVGTITVTGAGKHWPYWVASRLIGNVLTVKAWRFKEDEPDWGDPEAIKIFDTSVTNPGPSQGGNPNPGDNSGFTVPAPTTGRGYCGLVIAHLRNNAYMEYAQTKFIRLP